MSPDIETTEQSVQTLKARLGAARAERDRCEATQGHSDDFLRAHYHVRVLERCLAARTASESH